MEKIKFTRAELKYIERQADTQTSILFDNFNNILKFYKLADKKSRDLLNRQIDELIELYTFLKTLRSKLELWDCRFDIDTEIEYADSVFKEEDLK